MSRKQAREAAIKFTYQFDISPDNIEFQLLRYKEEENVDEDDFNYIKEVVNGVIDKKQKIDEDIAINAKDWAISRIAKVDLAILRVAIFEILYMDNIPYKVSINEAIELSKIYCEENSKSFINGILGAIVKDLQ